MSSDANKEYSVNWKNHMSHVRNAFAHLRNSNELTDVTLCCEGKKIEAHKMLLSACSSYFRDTFKEVPCQHPVIVLWGVEYCVLSDILQFIYNGEVSVDPAKLDSFLKVAQMLQISGLTDNPNDRLSGENESNTHTTTKFVDNDETFVESVPPPSSSEDANRGVKRFRTKEPEVREKVQRQDDTLFISDNIKCEPSEVVSGEDPLEDTDPLQQTDQSQDTKEFFVNANVPGIAEEEFKIEGAFLATATILETETKVRHSNFSEDCLKCSVCSKVFSHPYSLHHHKAVHSGNTQCPICHAVLSRKYNLKMHMKARHNL